MIFYKKEQKIIDEKCKKLYYLIKEKKSAYIKCLENKFDSELNILVKNGEEFKKVIDKKNTAEYELEENDYKHIFFKDVKISANNYYMGNLSIQWCVFRNIEFDLPILNYLKSLNIKNCTFINCKFDNLELDIKKDQILFYECCFYYCQFSNYEVKNGLLSEITFFYCNFNKGMKYKIKKKNINYYGCFFNECDEEEIKSYDCSYCGINIDKIDSAKYIDDGFTSCVFCDCLFSGTYNKSYMLRSIFRKCVVNGKWNESIFGDAIFTKDSRLNSLHLLNCNISGTKFNCLTSLSLKIKGDNTYISDETFINYRYKEEKGPGESSDEINIRYVKEKFNSLIRFSHILKENGERNRSADYIYYAKNLNKYIYKGINKVFYNIGKFTCGFGERASYTLVNVIIIMFIFSFLYLFNGIKINDIIIDYELCNLCNVDFKELIYNWSNCFFFSATTITTADSGNYNPSSVASSILAVLETIYGICMCAIGTSCVFRRMVD